MTGIVERHSPLPWVAEPDDRDGYEWNIHIVEASRPSNRVCFMTSNGPSEANADYIVTACNAYPGLMQEIERLRQSQSRLHSEIALTRQIVEKIVGRFIELRNGYKGYLPWGSESNDVKRRLASIEDIEQDFFRDIDSLRLELEYFRGTNK